MGLAAIKSRIRDACKKAGRSATAVTLVAVSKSQPVEKIEALLEQGQRVFGENRVQEAAEKFSGLREKYDGIELHLIGHLQTNKVKEAVRIFDVIESLDSIRLAGELAAEMKKQGRSLPCLIQVNTGGEAQKGGVAPQDLEALFRFCTEQANLRIEGLMCLPPVDDIPDLHFALLHKLAQGLSLPKLSMGMSADFETAIRYAATQVRVGSALFGTRENLK
ncbi:MAG: YggS family pyridoxal phosphate-dependent enzyme [Alphaproteobacteria bacterium]|nr:YggS family pyridoxal phosphate-dependent enzyme [Alphaproteobacteria bacterium]